MCSTAERWVWLTSAVRMTGWLTVCLIFLAIDSKCSSELSYQFTFHSGFRIRKANKWANGFVNWMSSTDWFYGNDNYGYKLNWRSVIVEMRSNGVCYGFAYFRFNFLKWKLSSTQMEIGSIALDLIKLEPMRSSMVTIKKKKNNWTNVKLRNYRPVPISFVAKSLKFPLECLTIIWYVVQSICSECVCVCFGWLFVLLTLCVRSSTFFNKSSNVFKRLLYCPHVGHWVSMFGHCLR